jgi:MFS family permease
MSTTPPTIRPSRTPLRGTLSPLRVPDYRRLLASNSLWWQAIFMEMIVVGWVVLELTNSAWHVALIGFYRSAPLMVMGFLSGPVSDRFGRRRVIIASQTSNLIVSLSVVTLLWTGHLQFWHLSVAAVILGTTWAVDWTARRALIPDLVGRSRTMDAMLLEGFTQNITRIAGPFTSGALIDAFGATGCYAVLAAVAALSLSFLLRMPRPRPRPGPVQTDPPLARMAAGLRYVRRHPAILGVFLITVAMNFLVFPYMTLLPVFARDVLGQGPVGLGLLGAASGAGSFVGLLLVNRIRHRIRLTWIFSVGSAMMACALVAFALSTLFSLSLALLLLSGIGQACFGILQSSIVLLTASDDMRSRAMGAIVLGIGAGPPGRLIIGGLAESLGAPFAVLVTSAAAALVVLLTLALLPGFRSAADEADTAGAETA